MIPLYYYLCCSVGMFLAKAMPQTVFSTWNIGKIDFWNVHNAIAGTDEVPRLQDVLLFQLLEASLASG